MKNESISINEVLEIIRRRKKSIIFPALFCIIAALVVAVVYPATYRSTSTILIEEQEVPRDYVTSTVTGYAEQRLHTINQRIMSTPKLLEIINRFNLYADRKKKETTEEIVERMRKDINFKTISADVIDPRTGNPTPATIAFSLSYDGQSPEVVQKVSNVLASLYLEENLRVREQQTSGTSNFIEEEMRGVKASLAEVEAKIAAFKERNINALPELAQLNYQELDRVDRDIESLNAQLRSLKEKEGYLQAQLATVPTDAAGQDKARLSDLRVQLGNLRSRVSENYPDVRKVKAEIAELEKRLRSAGQDGLGKPDNPAYINLASQLASATNEIDSVKRQIAALEKKRGSYSARISATPRVEEAYKSLSVERNTLQAKYDDLSKKFMEAKVAHGLEKEQKGERFTLIDAARVPEKPVSPKVDIIMLLGVIIGIGAGAATAALREHADLSVRSTEILARTVGFPVLAGIPYIITAEDIATTSKRRKIAAAGTAAGLLLTVLAVHFFVIDLTILWVKVMRRMAV